MKAFVFALSAISLTTASPIVVKAPGYDYATYIASHVLSPNISTQMIEPYGDQRPATTHAVGGDIHTSVNVNVGYVPDNLTEITDKYLFRLSIEGFEARRDSRHPATLDWSSDGCTKAPDHPGEVNFLPACHRHDFGIRNYREQGRLDKRAKSRIDKQFSEDLNHECDTHPFLRRQLCKVAAKLYYEFVKHIDPDLNQV